jgi:hypothetical protein
VELSRFKSPAESPSVRRHSPAFASAAPEPTLHLQVPHAEPPAQDLLVQPGSGGSLSTHTPNINLEDTQTGQAVTLLRVWIV